MAIGLNDVRKKKRVLEDAAKRRRIEKKSLDPQAQEFVETARPVRPWEAYDEQGQRTRTYRAQEAVKRAKEIVMRNELMINHLMVTKEMERKSESSLVDIDEVKGNDCGEITYKAPKQDGVLNRMKKFFTSEIHS